MKGASIVLDMWETSGNRLKGRVEAVENYLKWHDPGIKPELFRGAWRPLSLVLDKYMGRRDITAYYFSKIWEAISSTVHDGEILPNFVTFHPEFLSEDLWERCMSPHGKSESVRLDAVANLRSFARV
eukprot:Polyplicarium_translucidae@DN2413_c0_g1_i1.p2